jgi:hypothetical protein
VIGKTFKTIGSACTVAAALAVVAVPTASAKHRDDIRVTGACTDGATSKLKVKRDDGRLKFEFEVDQNVSGVAWDVQVTTDDRLVFDDRRVTDARSGSFSVERRIKHARSGTIAATATSESGETCTATATVDAKKPGVPFTTKPVTDPTPPTTVHDANGHHGNDD